MPEGNRRIGAEVFVTATQAREELKNVQADVRGVGTAAEGGGSRASAAMNGVASSAKASAAALGGSSRAANENKIAMQSYGREIALARAELAQMGQRLIDVTQKYGRNSSQAKDLRLQMAQLSAATRGLTADKAILAEEQKALEASTAKATTGFNRLTSQIRTSGTVFEGYDALLTAAAGATGGVTVATAVGISVLGSLAASVFSAGEAKKQYIALTEEELVANALVAQSYSQIASSVNVAAQGYFSFAQGSRAVVQGNIVNTLIETASAQLTLERATNDVNNAYAKLTTRSAELTLSHRSETLQREQLLQKIRDSSQTISEQQEILAKHLSSLRTMRDVFGLNTDQLIQFAVGAGRGTKEVEAMKRAIDSDIASLRQLASDLQNATGRMFNMEHAALRLAVALKEIKPPRISIENIQGIAGAQASLDRATQLVTGPFVGSPGLTRQSDVLRATEAEVKALRDQMRETAAATGATEKETLQLYNTYKNNLNPQQRELIGLLERSERNQKAFSASQRGGGGAARAYANELVNLIKQAEQSEAALLGDSFARREAQILATTKAQREHLEINKRDKVAALAAIDRIERAQLAKVEQDRVLAEQRIDDQIRQMRIQGIVDEYDRQKALSDFKFEQERQRIEKEFGISFRTLGLIIRAKMAAEEEFARWFINKQKQANDEAMRDAIRVYRQTMDARQEEINRGFDREADAFERQQDRIRNLLKKFGDSPVARGGARLIDINEIEQIDRMMQRLGVNINDVSDFFGFASRNARIFLLQLRAIEAFQKGQTLNGLLLSIKAIGLELIHSGELAFVFADALSTAFERAVAGSQSFTDALKAAFLNALADIAASFGRLAIAMGTAMLFIPGMGGKGAALIAAGVALMVLAGVLRGLASRIGQNQAQQGAGGAGAGGGGGASAGGRAGGDPKPIVVDLASSQVLDRHSRALENFTAGVNRGTGNEARIRELDERIRQLRVLQHSAFYRPAADILLSRAIAEREQLLSSVNVTTIASRRGGDSFTIQLDGPTTQRLMEGGKVTLDDLRGNGKNSSEVRQRIKKLAS
jgi:hypothetical protein